MFNHIKKIKYYLTFLLLKDFKKQIFYTCQIVDLSLYFKEESPGSTKTRCQLMAGGGNPRDSATENKPPYQGKGEKVW